MEIDPDGRIAIHCDHVEMGNGIGTALANRVAAHLGGVADEVAVAQVDTFGPLALVTSGDPYTMNQATQDAAAAQSALGAGDQHSHHRLDRRACRHACGGRGRARHVPLRAVAGGARLVGHRADRSESQAMGDGALERRAADHAGAAAAALPAIAAKAHARNFVTGAMAHGFSRWAWSQATFPIGRTSHGRPISMRWPCARARGKFARLDRTSVKFPPTDYNRIGTTYTSLCGTLVRIEIERATGALRIAKAYSVFECGQALVPEVVLGQAQGGFAMGVGYALLETLPPYEDGPGNGQWNLGQYLIARGSDLPLHDLEIEVLPPRRRRTRPPKGMAEVVMIPVVPALLNAIFDATGHRFQSLPVTQTMLKGALS